MYKFLYFLAAAISIFFRSDRMTSTAYLYALELSTLLFPPIPLIYVPMLWLFVASAVMSPKAPVTRLEDLRVSSHQISAFDRIPNTSIQRKPLLIFHSAFYPGTSASTIEAHLSAVGVVDPQWRYTMYSTSHFHSTTHEVLCIASGKAKLCFGGEDNPARVEPVVKEGDVIIVPAGVSHRLLEDLTGTFNMVGSYPRGGSWDMCYGKDGEEEKVKGIARLEWFERDPIYGNQGPALQQ